MSVGFVIEAERDARRPRDSADTALPAGVAGWLGSLLARVEAGRLLRRTLKPMRKTRVDELSAYMLRDIGWPPEGDGA